MKLGYTLIELIIVVSIVSVLVTLGVSAYGKARDKQAAQAAGEQILNILNENQKIAEVGKVDSNCTGKYTGQQVIFTGTNTIKSTSLCEDGPGNEISYPPIPGITFSASHTLIFLPLSRGITLSSDPLPLTLNYTIPSGSIYSITVTSSGTIEYLGQQ